MTTGPSPWAEDAPAVSPWGADASADIDETEDAAWRGSLWGEDESEVAGDVEMPENAGDVDLEAAEDPVAGGSVESAERFGVAERLEAAEGVVADGPFEPAEQVGVAERLETGGDAVADGPFEPADRWGAAGELGAAGDGEAALGEGGAGDVGQTAAGVEGVVVDGFASTGHEAVDAAVRAVDNASRLPVGEQLAAYEAAHTTLREVLGSIEE